MPQTLIIVAAFTGLALLLVLWPFARWRRQGLIRVSAGGTVVRTALGEVEYARSDPAGADGEAPVILLLHGGVGGWDQGLALADQLRLDKSFTVIAPSRPGYLGTPLESGRTPAEAADAMVALLDALEIESFGLVGVSGGGPTALQVALRHPSRVRALAMVCAISRRHEQLAQTTDSIVGRVVFLHARGVVVDFVAWLVGAQVLRWRPSLMASWLLKVTEPRGRARRRARVASIMRDPEQVAFMHALMSSIQPLSPRKRGLDNDLASYACIDDYPVGDIACPTLVVHGEVDANIPFEHAQFVADGVPGAELLVAEDIGHMLWFSDQIDGLRDAMTEFLMRHGPV